MNLYTQEIRKNPEGLAFDQELDLLKDLQKRNPEILDLKNVTATGRVAHDTGLYVLDYQWTTPSFWHLAAAWSLLSFKRAIL